MVARLAWILSLLGSACARGPGEGEGRPAAEGKADVYGEDDRREVYEYDPGDARRVASRSTAAVVRIEEIEPVPESDGLLVRLRPGRDPRPIPLCDDEPHRAQPSVATGSAVLVAPTAMATAYHVTRMIDCEHMAFVFGFAYEWGPWQDPLTIATDDVRRCQEVLTPDSESDSALVLLDRAVGHRPSLAIDGDPGAPAVGAPLTMIGHPMGVPTKIAEGSVVSTGPFEAFDAPLEGVFLTDLDAYRINSGSALLDPLGRVVGLLMAGGDDFAWDDSPGCWRSLRCPEVDRSVELLENCSGNLAARASELRDLLP